jgi:hypothetical protein
MLVLVGFVAWKLWTGWLWPNCICSVDDDNPMLFVAVQVMLR